MSMKTRSGCPPSQANVCVLLGSDEVPGGADEKA